MFEDILEKEEKVLWDEDFKKRYLEVKKDMELLQQDGYGIDTDGNIWDENKHQSKKDLEALAEKIREGKIL